MPESKRRLPGLMRGLLKLCACLLALGLLALTTLPYWLAWPLGRILDNHDAEFENYSRNSYGQFQLDGVSVNHPAAEVQINTLKVLSPLNWLWRAWQGDRATPYLSAGSILIELKDAPSSATSEPTSFNHLVDALAELNELLALSDTWLPFLEAEQITVVKDGETVTLNQLVWQGRILHTRLVAQRFEEDPTQVTVDFTAAGPDTVIEIPSRSFTLRSRLNPLDDEVHAQSSIQFAGNQGILQLRFGTSGWLPETANWNLPDWTLGLQSVLPQSPYDQLAFSLTGNWTEQRFQNELSGRMTLSETDEVNYLPSLDFDAAFDGTAGSINVDRFSITGPGITAVLSDPIRMNPVERTLEGDLDFNLDVDLAELGQETLTGQLKGLLELESIDGKPVGHFTFQADELRYQEYRLSGIATELNLDWPLLDIQSFNASADLVSDLQITGRIDLETQRADGLEVAGQVGGESIQPWLPSGLSLDSIEFAGSATGSIEDLAHSGTATITTLENETFRPVSGLVTWRGRLQSIEQFKVELASAGHQLSSTGEAFFSTESSALTLKTLEITDSQEWLAQLKQAARIELNRSAKTQLSIEPLQIEAPGSQLLLEAKIDMPMSATWSMTAENVSTEAWLNPWLKEPLPPIRLDQLTMKGEWNDGPITFQSQLAVSLQNDDQSFFARGELASNGSSFKMNDLEIADADGPWVTASGELPIQIYPGQETWLAMDDAAPLTLELLTSESQNWINWLSQYWATDITAFDTQAILSGTLSNPKGTFNLDLKTRASEQEYGTPATRIQTRGSLQGTEIEVETLQIEVGNQTLEATGQLNLPEELIGWWNETDREIPWMNTHFSCTIPSSSLSPLRYFFPQFLSEGGNIEAELAGSPKAGMTGYLKVQNLSTRHMFPFGAIRDVTTELNFRNREATLSSFSGYIGQESIEASGAIDYANWDQPLFHFEMSGQDVPIVRKPGLLLRSDLNILVEKKDEEPALVSGQVNLKY